MFGNLFKSREEKKKLKADAANALRIFKKIKESCTEVTMNSLKMYMEEAEKHILDFVKTGQWLAKSKTEWLLECAIKEQELVKLGITRCCFRDDVRKFCEDHPTRVLKICDVADYERIIPVEGIDIMEKTKDIFDQFVIVYTDHTKKSARKTEKVRDPILFGIFMSDIVVSEPDSEEENPEDGKAKEPKKPVLTTVMSDRMYVLYDWEDDQCDLTWSRMLRESADNGTKVTAQHVADHVPLMTRIGRVLRGDTAED